MRFYNLPRAPCHFSKHLKELTFLKMLQIFNLTSVGILVVFIFVSRYHVGNTRVQRIELRTYAWRTLCDRSQIEQTRYRPIGPLPQ